MEDRGYIDPDSFQIKEQKDDVIRFVLNLQQKLTAEVEVVSRRAHLSFSPELRCLWLNFRFSFLLPCLYHGGTTAPSLGMTDLAAPKDTVPLRARGLLYYQLGESAHPQTRHVGLKQGGGQPCLQSQLLSSVSHCTTENLRVYHQKQCLLQRPIPTSTHPCHLTCSYGTFNVRKTWLLPK